MPSAASNARSQTCFTGNWTAVRHAVKTDWNWLALPQREMGPGIAARPHCAERRICRCSQPWLPNPKARLPVLDPGAPAQASLSIAAVRRPGSLFGLAPERASPPNSPPLGPKAFATIDVPRPFLGWVPSTRPCLPGGETAFVQGATSSSGASCRLVRSSVRRVIALAGSSASNLVPSPAGGDRSFCRLPHRLAVAGCLGRRGLPSRSQLEGGRGFRVAPSGKCRPEPVDNGDIGCN